MVNFYDDNYEKTEQNKNRETFEVVYRTGILVF